MYQGSHRHCSQGRCCLTVQMVQAVSSHTKGSTYFTTGSRTAGKRLQPLLLAGGDHSRSPLARTKVRTAREQVVGQPLPPPTATPPPRGGSRTHTPPQTATTRNASEHRGHMEAHSTHDSNQQQGNSQTSPRQSSSRPARGQGHTAQQQPPPQQPLHTLPSHLPAHRAASLQQEHKPHSTQSRLPHSHEHCNTQARHSPAPVMILPQVHLQKPWYNFYFL